MRRLRDRDSEKYNIPANGKEVENLVKSDRLYLFTDAFVDNIVKQAVIDFKGATDKDGKVIQALANSIQRRKPPDLLAEVPVCEETKREYHAGKTFMRNCRTKLEDLAKEFNVPLKQFLLCGITLPVVKEPQKHTTAEITKFDQQKLRDMAHEEEGEDIKIFYENEDEPKSLIETEYSIVVKYASYSLQMFRLYVVYEGEDKDSIIAKLREAVKDWHKE